MIIAIDGPSAAGKGTLARGIANKLGYHFLDTGSLYRMVGLAMLQGEYADTDTQSAERIAKALEPATMRDEELRSEAVAAMASKVAVMPEVRLALLDFQRQFAKRYPGAVLDGRDIGTVVCPDADLKFFVTAATDIRAKRRHDELSAQGQLLDYADVLADVMARDERDANRKLAPTSAAEDAIMIDTSELDAEEVLKAVLQVIAEFKSI